MAHRRLSPQQRRAELLARLRARAAGQRAAEIYTSYTPQQWGTFSAAERQGFLEGIGDALDAYTEGLARGEAS